MFGDHFLYSRDCIFDQVEILLGEIRCLSLLRLKGLSSVPTSSLLDFTVNQLCLTRVTPNSLGLTNL